MMINQYCVSHHNIYIVLNTHMYIAVKQTLVHGLRSNISDTRGSSTIRVQTKKGTLLLFMRGKRRTPFAFQNEQ